MRSRSRRYRSDVERRTTSDALTIEQSVEALKKFQGTKFDETVEIAIRTGLDPKQANQAVRGSFSLPHGIGKKVRVIAFCEGNDVKAATDSGAIAAGGQELAKKIEEGWADFDVAIAHPSAMRFVGKLGRILGPQGKMPAPKSGTVAADIGRVVAEFVAGKIEFKTDPTGIIHAPMGKKSFSKEHLTDNLRAFVEHIVSVKPSSAKGHYLRSIYVKSTMSPSVQIATASYQE